MAKTTTIPFPQTITTFGATIVNATSFTAANPGTAPTNTLLLYTAAANDAVIKSLLVSSNDTSSATVQFWLSKDSGTTKYLIGSVVVAGLSGAATLINVDVLGNAILTGFDYNETGKCVLPLSASDRIYIGVITSAVTASKNVYVTGIAEEY